jgi:alpha,alpha-trehalose phosphorylase
VGVARPPRHDGVWHVDGVTGPDEYSAVADDNVFTNLMAQPEPARRRAACARRPEPPPGLGVRPDEPGAWQAAADAVHVPYDEKLGVHPQAEGFTRYAPWDFPPNARTTR